MVGQTFLSVRVRHRAGFPNRSDYNAAMIAWLFLNALAAGTAAVVALLKPDDVGIRFLRFYAAFPSVLVFIALALQRHSGEPDFAAAPALASAIAGLAACALHGLSLCRLGAAAITACALLGGATLCSTAAHAQSLEPLGTPGRIAAAVSWITSAALLGSLLMAMLVGHQFLQRPNLPLRVLKGLSLALIGSTAVRLLATGAVIAVAWPAVRVRFGTPDEWVEHMDGVYLLVRLLVGLVGPLGFGWMVWETVRIRSTQSATGILYGVLIFVFLGELTAFLLFRSYGIPL